MKRLSQTSLEGLFISWNIKYLLRYTIRNAPFRYAHYPKSKAYNNCIISRYKRQIIRSDVKEVLSCICDWLKSYIKAASPGGVNDNHKQQSVPNLSPLLSFFNRYPFFFPWVSFVSVFCVRPRSVPILWSFRTPFASVGDSPGRLLSQRRLLFCFGLFIFT